MLLHVLLGSAQRVFRTLNNVALLVALGQHLVRPQVCRKPGLVLNQARQKSVTISTDVPDDLPPLMAGELRLKQVMVNLLSNAVKFSREGGAITLTARLAENGDLAIVVADQGIGMKPQDIPIALEPFRQIDNALSRSYEGTGLGLPLAKMLVEKHGGTLTLESTPGVGTTVTVTLPKSRLQLAAALATAAQ